MNRMNKLLAVALALAMPLVAFASPLASEATDRPAPDGNSWKFDVFLDNKEIGYHHFHMAESGETRQLKSVASFEYKLLFVACYHYEHENQGDWNGDCLAEHPVTDRFQWRAIPGEGRREAGQFRVADYRATSRCRNA